MDNSLIQEFEQQIDELLRISRQLHAENKLLKDQKATWMTERAKLIEKTNVARDRIEQMMEKLKQLNSEV